MIIFLVITSIILSFILGFKSALMFLEFCLSKGIEDKKINKIKVMI